VASVDRFERSTAFEVAIVLAVVAGALAALLAVLTSFAFGTIALVAAILWAVGVVAVLVFVAS
jgi:hypothetical protein